MYRLYISILLSLFIYSCNTTSNELYEHINLDEFIIEDGFSIELVAGEPLLDSPMAMDFDHQGRIWVAEMPGYMRDIEGSEEEAPDGRIVILEDTDGDGKMDSRKVFLDSLVLPRAIRLVYGGLLYAETPYLYWTSIEGDKPHKRELVDSFYVQGGNIEHQPNGLLYNIDNWIYSAKSNARYRRKNGKWLKEATTFRGQWGITNDNLGRLFANDNSNPLYGDFTLPNTLVSNPYQKIKFSLQQNIGEDRRVYPYQATAVNRGYQDGVLDTVTQKLLHFTSSCSPLIYRGNQFTKEHQNNAFVCGPEVNLIKRFIIKEDSLGQISANQAYEDKEFLVSKDETFRPINLYNAPDGSMYVLDLRKGVIQHRAYMSRYLYDKIQQKQLDSITGIGRIYKINSTISPRKKIKELPSNDKVKDWLALLQSQNSWQREQAQQWLINHPDIVDFSKIERLIVQTGWSHSKIHGLWALEGLNKLKGKLLVKLAMQERNPAVWATILKLSSVANKAEQAIIFKQAYQVNNKKIHWHLAQAVGQAVQDGDSKLWLKLADKYKKNPQFSEALISGIHGFERGLLKHTVGGERNDTLHLFLKKVIQNINQGKRQAPKIKIQKEIDPRNRSMNLYAMHCGSCHGVDGMGIENLAPPLYKSEYIAGNPNKLIKISLHGMKGEVTVNGQTYNFNAPMPGYNNNPTLNDETLAGILSYIRNGFGAEPSGISAQEVAKLRQELKGRTTPFTAIELD